MKALNIPEAQQLVRVGTVLQILPVSPSAWYRMIVESPAPKPIGLDPRSVAWRLGDILAVARGEWHSREESQTGRIKLAIQELRRATDRDVQKERCKQ